MTAYLLVTLAVQDALWVTGYAAVVPALVAKHGGAYLVVADTIRRYEGDGATPDAIVLFTFPSPDAVEAFLADPDYQPWKVLRQQGSTGDMFVFTPRA